MSDIKQLDNKTKILYYMSWGTIIFVFMILVTVLGLLLWPYNPLEIKTSPFKVLTPTVKAGEDLIYTFDYCKNTTEEPTVTREYVDGIIFRSASTRAKVVTGCGTATVHETVPVNLPPGPYVLRATVIYQPNLLRNIKYVNETEQFNVIK